MFGTLRRTALAAATVVAFVPTVASAQITVYNTLSSWLAATTNVGIDTYNDFSLSGVTPSPITRTAAGAGGIAYGYTGTATNGFYGAGSSADRWLSTNTASDAIVLTGFGSSARAIGGNFFLSDILGSFVATGQITISIVAGGVTSSRTLTDPTTSTFLGFVTSAPITSLTVTAVQPATGFNWSTINDLRIAQAAPTGVIPEPSTYVLMATGLAGLAALRRRRRA